MTKTEQLLNKLIERIFNIRDALSALHDDVEACQNHEALEPFVEGRLESDLEFAGFEHLQTACNKVFGLFHLLEEEMRELHNHREQVDDLRNEISSRSKRLKKLQTPSTGE